jgi:hypothetical protein
MGIYIERDNNNNIIGRFAVEQFLGQEYLEDNNPELLVEELAKAKDNKRKEIERKQHLIELTGFEYANNFFEFDTISQGKIGNMTLRAFLSLTPNTGIEWLPLEFVAADNNVHVFENAVDFIPFAQTAANAAQTTFAYRTTLKQACRSANNIAELDAIDIYTGWPEFNS